LEIGVPNRPGPGRVKKEIRDVQLKSFGIKTTTQEARITPEEAVPRVKTQRILERNCSYSAITHGWVQTKIARGGRRPAGPLKIIGNRIKLDL